MRDLFYIVDNPGQYVPEGMKWVLRPFVDPYRHFTNHIYRYLPEKPRETPWNVTLMVDLTNPVERNLSTGSFEQDAITYFINELVSEDVVRFADVGANIGFYSILFEKESALSATVDAFEPMYANRDRFGTNIELNGCERINIHPYGLAETNKEVQFKLPERDPAQATAGDIDGEVSTAAVEMRTLDTIYSKGGEAPDLIKIDVEGGELSVLQGGEQLLCAEQPDIFLELHPERIHGLGGTVEELFNLLLSAGYRRVYDIEQDQTRSIESAIKSGIKSGSHLHIVP